MRGWSQVEGNLIWEVGNMWGTLTCNIFHYQVSVSIRGDKYFMIVILCIVQSRHSKHKDQKEGPQLGMDRMDTPKQVNIGGREGATRKNIFPPSAYCLLTTSDPHV